MEAVGVGADCIYRIFSIEEDGNTEIESMFSPTPNLQYICQERSNNIFDNDFHFHMMMMMMMDNEKNHDGVFVPSSHTVAEHVTMNEDDETSENLELPLDNKKKRKDNAVGNKKKQKVESNGKEIEESNDNYAALEDDNGTNNYNKEENSGGATSSVLNSSNGKTRVTRGSATDPQSLYARRRRERINERLRTLQSLVPNGTKVDISTMLEEAVHYVKFLQLQIKLLSSDDLWMYAPIAYNGFDIGLINLSPQQH